MKLHFLLGVAVLAGSTALAQERPAPVGEKPGTPARIDPAEQAAPPAENTAKPARKPRLAQPDNPLDPNRPPKSTREPAKIRPAEQGGTPAENTDKIDKKGDKKDDKKDDNDARATGQRADQQASRPPRRAVLLVVGTMPAAAPPATYGPRLEVRSAIGANAPTNLPTTAIAPVQPAPVPVPGPAIVNSCSAGGCTDSNGVRYNGTPGGVMIGPQGQQCHHNGATVQC